MTNQPHNTPLQEQRGFNEPMGELFGRYCTIEMKRHYSDNEFYKHKVIGLFKSNTWVDAPIQSPATETPHKEMEDVINVICCGVREDTVYRVRLKDVKLEANL